MFFTLFFSCSEGDKNRLNSKSEDKKREEAAREAEGPDINRYARRTISRKEVASPRFPLYIVSELDLA